MKKILFSTILFTLVSLAHAQTSQKSNAKSVKKNTSAIEHSNTSPTLNNQNNSKNKGSKEIPAEKIESLKQPAVVVPISNSPSENTSKETKQSNTPAVQNTERISNTGSIQSKEPLPAQTTKNNNAVYAELESYMEEVLENKPNGNINWTQQYIEAKGQSVIDTDRFKNNAQARAMATRGAVVVAQRNLLEMVQGVYVVGETTVQDMITMSDYIYTRVEGVVKGAVQFGPAREVDGMIEVTMRMPIYGQKGIAGAFEEQDLANAKKRNGYRDAPANTLVPTGDDVIDGSKPFVFSIKGKQIDPSMFPVVVDDNGNIQFDFSTLYDTKTGKFPQYVQMSKRFMDDVGFQKGVDVIELVQNGKGEFTLSKNNKKSVFWQRVGNIAKGLGKFLFNIVV